jgi:hypothetical protein
VQVVVAGQADVIPAERSEVSEQGVVDGTPIPERIHGAFEVHRISERDRGDHHIQPARAIPLILVGDRGHDWPVAVHSDFLWNPMRRTVITGKSYRHSWQQHQGNPALAFASTLLPLDTVHAHLCSANPLMDRVLRRLGIKSDTDAPN